MAKREHEEIQQVQGELDRDAKIQHTSPAETLVQPPQPKLPTPAQTDPSPIPYSPEQLHFLKAFHRCFTLTIADWSPDRPSHLDHAIRMTLYHSLIEGTKLACPKLFGRNVFHERYRVPPGFRLTIDRATKHPASKDRRHTTADDNTTHSVFYLTLAANAVRDLAPLCLALQLGNAALWSESQPPMRSGMLPWTGGPDIDDDYHNCLAARSFYVPGLCQHWQLKVQWMRELLEKLPKFSYAWLRMHKHSTWLYFLPAQGVGFPANNIARVYGVRGVGITCADEDLQVHAIVTFTEGPRFLHDQSEALQPLKRALAAASNSLPMPQVMVLHSPTVVVAFWKNNTELKAVLQERGIIGGGVRIQTETEWSNEEKRRAAARNQAERQPYAGHSSHYTQQQRPDY